MWRLDGIERARARVTPQCCDTCLAAHNATPDGLCGASVSLPRDQVIGRPVALTM
jgi:hypothetical protein